MGKKKQKEVVYDSLSPEEYYNKLNACINCVNEDKCSLPFPINLCESCENYIKVIKTFDTL